MEYHGTHDKNDETAQNGLSNSGSNCFSLIDTSDVKFVSEEEENMYDIFREADFLQPSADDFMLIITGLIIFIPIFDISLDIFNVYTLNKSSTNLERSIVGVNFH